MQILRIWKEPEFKLLMQRACGVNFLLNDYDDDDDDDDQCLSNFIFLLWPRDLDFLTPKSHHL